MEIKENGILIEEKSVCKLVFLNYTGAHGTVIKGHFTADRRGMVLVV